MRRLVTHLWLQAALLTREVAGCQYPSLSGTALMAFPNSVGWNKGRIYRGEIKKIHSIRPSAFVCARTQRCGLRHGDATGTKRVDERDTDRKSAQPLIFSGSLLTS